MRLDPQQLDRVDVRGDRRLGHGTGVWHPGVSLTTVERSATVRPSSGRRHRRDERIQLLRRELAGEPLGHRPICPNGDPVREGRESVDGSRPGCRRRRSPAPPVLTGEPGVGRIVRSVLVDRGDDRDELDSGRHPLRIDPSLDDGYLALAVGTPMCEEDDQLRFAVGLDGHRRAVEGVRRRPPGSAADRRVVGPGRVRRQGGCRRPRSPDSMRHGDADDGAPVLAAGGADGARRQPRARPRRSRSRARTIMVPLGPVRAGAARLLRDPGPWRLSDRMMSGAQRSSPASPASQRSARINRNADSARYGRLMKPNSRNQTMVHGVVAEQTPESSQGSHSSA